MRGRSPPYHEHNAAEARPRALKRIAEGQALALISDAGTPLISDPGYKLVAEAIELGFAVIAAPGPSAALAALCVAGLPTDRFYFEGFLPPRQSARRERINALAAVPGTLIFYEAAGRLAETLADLALELGPRPAAVARELTKLHEEVRRGALDKLAAEYAAGGAPRGEIVIVVGAAEERAVISEAALDQEIAEQLDKPVGQGRGRGDRRQTWAAETAGLCARAGDCRRPAMRSRADQRTERRRDAHLYGLKAESIAALLLRLKGYTILARRFVVSGGEIDLVARRGGSIAFVEVKARADLEVAAIAISATKRRRIARAARVWLTRNPWAAGLTLRGDAVFVARGRLPRHEPDAYRLEID